MSYRQGSQVLEMQLHKLVKIKKEKTKQQQQLEAEVRIGHG